MLLFVEATGPGSRLPFIICLLLWHGSVVDETVPFGCLAFDIGAAHPGIRRMNNNHRRSIF